MNTRVRSRIPRFRSLPVLFYTESLLPVIVLFLLVSTFLLGTSAADAAQSVDPLEPVNRMTLGFNRAIDTVVFKPLAKTYEQLTPKFVKTGIRNFFGNLGELSTITNDLLQGQFGQAVTDLGRFTVNSTVGLGGLIDVADPVLGLPQNDQDFGRTLATWGVQSGPYLVLPLLGPSTLRDALGTGFDTALNPVTRSAEHSQSDPLLATQAIDTRARYLPLDDLIFGDGYLFIRELYLQNRHYQLHGESMGVAFSEF